MHVILTEPTRIDKLKAWLRMHRISYAVLAGYLGMSVTRTSTHLVNCDFASARRVAQLRVLGVPEELLPAARERKRRRPPKGASAAL